MEKVISVVTALVACLLMSAKIPFSERIVRSETAGCAASSCPEEEGKGFVWNCETGMKMLSVLDVYRVCGDNSLLSYADSCYDALVDEDGNVSEGYRLTDYSLAQVCPARTLFSLYDLTGKEKYRLAIERVGKQIAWQPRTLEGGFSHDKACPQQLWLDDLYMAEPFYVEYISRYLSGESRQLAFEDVVREFLLAADRCFDSSTGLLRHAWDASYSAFWCESETGQSAHAFGQGLGWYCMAVVETLPLIPEDTPGRDRLVSVFRDIYDSLMNYTDAVTGMWFQVLDRPHSEGNFVEASAGAMLTFAMLKGVRLGYLERRMEPVARRCAADLKRTFVRVRGKKVILSPCCARSGLGGSGSEDGSFSYYINREVVENDCKGIAPLVWTFLELESGMK